MNSFIIIYLIIMYYINNTIGTNLLPLEVFEISSAAVVQQQQQQQQSHSNNNNIIFNSDNINKYNISNNNNNDNNINSNNNYINNNNNNTKINNNNIINKNSSNNNNLFKRIYKTNNINSNILPFISNQIKLEQNKNINNINNNNNINNKNRRSSRQMTNTQDNLLNDELLMPHRILYQVGESEEDLPLCAPNAVCSKIDVYDIPWIERQCRCPTVYTNKIHIHHHHHHHHPHNNPITNTNTIKQIKHNNGKLSHNTQKYNNMQQQQRHFYDVNNRKIEDIHIKKFMQKLQSVHREDLILSENDLQTSNEQIQKNNLNLLMSSEQQQQLQQNKEQPLKQQQNLFILRKIFRQIPLATKAAGSYIIKARDTNKLRHSGHLGHHQQQHHHHNHPHREISFLGGCPNDIRTDDGFTISDKTRHYKLCNPVHKLPLCNSFTDFTWTVTTMPELNVTEQIVHCRCRPNSVTYLTKWEPNTHSGYTYYFACSPQNRLRCQRKEPCRLFTVRQRQEHLDEVNTNPLCQCPRDHKCPVHHTDSGVVAGESYMDDNIKTYAGYCMAND